MRRPTTEIYVPPPVCATSSATPTRTSVSVEDTLASAADALPPALASLIVPAPPPTEKLEAPPETVHAPPLSAVPQPPVTVRPKASVANGVTAPWATVIGLVTVPVAPWLSVTVRVTLYVAAVAYVCGGVAPVPVAPSPKFHAYDAMVPSLSADPPPLKLAIRPAADDVNAAVGAALETVTLCCIVPVPPRSLSLMHI